VHLRPSLVGATHNQRHRGHPHSRGQLKRRGGTNAPLRNHQAELKSRRWYPLRQGHVKLVQRKREAFTLGIDVCLLSSPAAEEGLVPFLGIEGCEVSLVRGARSIGERWNLRRDLDGLVPHQRPVPDFG
jgi:hypothetical protein